MLTQDELLILQKKVEIIARNAGQFVLSRWSDVLPQSKGVEGDIVTEVDAKVEEQLKHALSGLVDGAYFFGEESGGELDGEYLWIIDPIDGTKNFAHKMPAFYVQFALLYKKNPILGIVYTPLGDQMFSASYGNGCYLNSVRIDASELPPINKSMIDIDFGGTELLDWKINTLKKLANEVYRVRISAGMFAVYLLTGGTHAFVVINPTTKLWDQAPRIILFQEAGFEVEQFEVDGHKVILASKGELFLKLKEIIINTVAL